MRPCDLIESAVRGADFLKGEAFQDGCPARKSAESRVPWCSAKQTPGGRRQGGHLRPKSSLRGPWPDGINHSPLVQSELIVQLKRFRADISRSAGGLVESAETGRKDCERTFLASRQRSKRADMGWGAELFRDLSQMKIAHHY